MPPVYWPLCCLFPHWELKSVSSKAGWCQIQICIYPVVLNIAQTSRCWPLLRLLDLHNPRNLTSHLPAIDELEPCGYEAPGGYSSLRSLTQRLLATFWETSHRYCKPCFHPLSLENSLIILHFWVAIPLCHRLWTNSRWKGHSPDTNLSVAYQSLCDLGSYLFLWSAPKSLRPLHPLFQLIPIPEEHSSIFLLLPLLRIPREPMDRDTHVLLVWSCPRFGYEVLDMWRLLGMPSGSNDSIHSVPRLKKSYTMIVGVSVDTFQNKATEWEKK